MFSKRIKYVRDINQEIDILHRKSDREISKLNGDIATQIKKKFRKFSPGIQIEISKVKEEDFRKKQKRSIPICVFIESVNNRKVHKNGFWVDEVYSETDSIDFEGYIKTENILTVEQLTEVCYELSEDLGMSVNFIKVDGKVIY